MGSKQVIQQDKVTPNGAERRVALFIDDRMFTPEELEHYNKINPDFARELINMASREQKQRHDNEKADIEILKRSESYTFRMNVLGVIIAFLIVLLLFTVATVAIIYDKDALSIAFGSGGFITLVGLFLSNRNIKK